MIKKKCISCDFLKKDPLTEVFRREYFIQLLNKDNNNWNNYYLCIADIDHFKRFNDDYGHFAGDHVLKSFSKCVNDFLVRGEICGRFGGEEFVFLIEHRKERIEEFFDFVKQKLRSIDFESEKLPDITFSLGVSNLELSFDSSFIKADKALYYSKNTGRDKITFYNDMILDQNYKNVLKKDNKTNKSLYFSILGLKNIDAIKYKYGINKKKYLLTRLKEKCERLFKPLDIFIWKDMCICFTFQGISKKNVQGKLNSLSSEKDLYGVINIYPGITEFNYIFQDTFEGFISLDLYRTNRGVHFYDIKMLRNSGNYFFRNQDYKKAYKYFRRAYRLESNKDDEKTVINLTSSLIKLKKYLWAEIILKNRTFPKKTALYYVNLAHSLYFRNKYQESLDICIKGAELFPKNRILKNNISEIKCILKK